MSEFCVIYKRLPNNRLRKTIIEATNKIEAASKVKHLGGDVVKVTPITPGSENVHNRIPREDFD